MAAFGAFQILGDKGFIFLANLTSSSDESFCRELFDIALHLPSLARGIGTSHHRERN